MEKVWSQGGRIYIFDYTSRIRDSPREFTSGTIANYEGYRTHVAAGLRALKRCVGVFFVTGTRGSADSLVPDGIKEDPPLLAKQLVLATVAWTSRLIDLTSSAVSTSQPVDIIQLTAVEADRLRRIPIAIDLDSGIFVFLHMPDTNILKCERHGYGYETRVSATTPAG